MKNKTWIWICALVVVILAVLLIWKPFGSKAGPAEPAADGEQTVAQSAAQDPAAAQNAGDPTAAGSEGEASGEEDVQPMIIEDGGDLEIVIPEGQATGGF